MSLDVLVGGMFSFYLLCKFETNNVGNNFTGGPAKRVLLCIQSSSQICVGVYKECLIDLPPNFPFVLLHLLESKHFTFLF